jgi:hypothetical protein
MPSGGAREGAGRPTGAVTRKTREAAERAKRLGTLTPLDVMLQDMKHHYTLYEIELAKKRKADPAAVAKHLREARDAAEAAAPYMHAKYAAIAVKTENTDEWSEFMRTIDGTTRGLPSGQTSLFDVIDAKPLPEPVPAEADYG